jgi:pimeloyl-ACP methyl ester carboxylesterase
MPYLEGVSHRDVNAAGIRFHVAEAGSGDPVLLLHGWPQNWYCWRKVIPLLCEQRRVICPDLRGFGWSDAPPGRYEKQTFVDDTLALMDALELEQVDLITHDWGAWTGFQLCLQHPSRIARHLALNIVTPWPDPPSLRGAAGVWRIFYQLPLSTPGLAHLLLRRTDFVGRLISSGAVHRDAWTAADLNLFEEVLREPARTAASIHLYRTFLRRELVPYFAGKFGQQRLTVPTLLLHGMKDLAVDHRRLGQWQTHADDMAVEFHQNSGHFIAEELPEIVAARARALFDGSSPQDVVASAVDVQ